MLFFLKAVKGEVRTKIAHGEPGGNTAQARVALRCETEDEEWLGVGQKLTSTSTPAGKFVRMKVSVKTDGGSRMSMRRR
jgi:hypothetical protein